MRKKQVWRGGCIILMLLVYCTVLSIQIENLMRIEVSVTTGESGKEGEVLLPQRSVHENEMGNIVYCVEEVAGKFRTEEKVQERPITVYGKENGYVIADRSSLTNDYGGMLRVIVDSSYPVKENEVVEIIPGGKNQVQERHWKMMEQIKWLAVFPALLPVWILWCNQILKLLDGFWKHQYVQGVAGGAALVIQAAILYGITSMVQIPRKFLPKEQIFDISFYADRIHHFFFEMDNLSGNPALYREIRYEYLSELCLYGALCIALWLGMVLWSTLKRRK